MSSPAKTTRKPQKEATPEVEEFDFGPILKWVGPATVVILLLSAGFFWMRSQGQQAHLATYQAFTDATTRQEGESATDQANRLIEMSKAYLGQPEAALALLQAGSIFYNEGDYEAALQAYELMVEKYGSHEMVENAAWGALHCQEELGQLDVALAGYKAIPKDALLHPQSVLATARVLEKQGKWSEALTVYEQVTTDYAETPWAGQAEVFSQQATLQAEKPATAE